MSRLARNRPGLCLLGPREFLLPKHKGLSCIGHGRDGLFRLGDRLVGKRSVEQLATVLLAFMGYPP